MLLLKRLPSRVLMLTGAGALLTGAGVTIVAVTAGSAAAFFTGTVIAGIGFGGGFQGAIRSVLPLAAPHQRAGVLSVVYVVSYLAFGAPAVIAGFLVVHEGSVLATAQQYGTAVMALAALALIGAARPSRQDTPEQTPVPVRAPQAGVGERCEAGLR